MGGGPATSTVSGRVCANIKVLLQYYVVAVNYSAVLYGMRYTAKAEMEPCPSFYPSRLVEAVAQSPLSVCGISHGESWSVKHAHGTHVPLGSRAMYLYSDQNGRVLRVMSSLDRLG